MKKKKTPTQCHFLDLLWSQLSSVFESRQNLNFKCVTLLFVMTRHLEQSERESIVQATKQRKYKHTISPINRVVIAIIIQIGFNQTMEQSHTIKLKKMFWTFFSKEFLFHTNTTIGIFLNIIMQHVFSSFHGSDDAFVSVFSAHNY